MTKKPRAAAAATENRFADAVARLHGATWCTAILAAETADDLAAATVAASAPFGLHTVMAGAIIPLRDKVEARFYFGNWPGPWRELYPAEILGNDPLVVEARRRMAPFTWRELEAEDTISEAMRAAIAKTRANGWQDGLAVPIHGPGGYTALVSFAGGEIALSPADRAELLSIAHVAHLRGRAIAPAFGAGATLSARELQVMQLVASGKTDWEIARILGMAESTAHFHVEQSKRKLSAHSRSQAVGALILGCHL